MVGRLSTSRSANTCPVVDDPLTGVHVADADFEEQILNSPP